jgi:hypothetical protein
MASLINDNATRFSTINIGLIKDIMGNSEKENSFSSELDNKINYDIFLNCKKPEDLLLKLSFNKKEIKEILESININNIDDLKLYLSNDLKILLNTNPYVNIKKKYIYNSKILILKNKFDQFTFKFHKEKLDNLLELFHNLKNIQNKYLYIFTRDEKEKVFLKVLINLFKIIQNHIQCFDVNFSWNNLTKKYISYKESNFLMLDEHIINVNDEYNTIIREETNESYYNKIKVEMKELKDQLSSYLSRTKPINDDIYYKFLEKMNYLKDLLDCYRENNNKNCEKYCIIWELLNRDFKEISNQYTITKIEKNHGENINQYY